MYYLYVIKSVIKSYVYVGITSDVNRRVSEHNKGYNKTTKTYSPFKLILKEKYEDRIAARAREKYLKSGSGREYLRKILDRN